MTQRAIAAELDVSLSTVRNWIRRARLTELPDFDFSDRLRILCNGSGSTCIHGLPMVQMDDERLSFCTECEQTNRPNHRAWRRGKPIEKRVSEDQPNGAPRSSLGTVTSGTVIYATTGKV